MNIRKVIYTQKRLLAQREPQAINSHPSIGIIEAQPTNSML